MFKHTFSSTVAENYSSIFVIVFVDTENLPLPRACKVVKERHPAESNQLEYQGMDCYNKNSYVVGHCMGNCPNSTSCYVSEWKTVTVNLKCFACKYNIYPSYPSKLFKTEFTIVIFIHYKPRIAVAILDL